MYVKASIYKNYSLLYTTDGILRIPCFCTLKNLNKCTKDHFLPVYTELPYSLLQLHIFHCSRHVPTFLSAVGLHLTEQFSIY